MRTLYSTVLLIHLKALGAVCMEINPIKDTLSVYRDGVMQLHRLCKGSYAPYTLTLVYDKGLFLASNRFKNQ